MLEYLIRKAQRLDAEMTGLAEKSSKEQLPDLRTDKKGTLWFRNHLCVPKGEGHEILQDEAHNSAYSIHPGSTKMYLCNTPGVTQGVHPGLHHFELLSHVG
jgi:hypothetical protein